MTDIERDHEDDMRAEENHVRQRAALARRNYNQTGELPEEPETEE